ncbi:uncharacterized protein N7477_005273 [Penicillium maclennaniae]|uniref:uncharacterized protein n=1 Tax=Penicillium maclennaniae TaxID=1343394 RepID=UPI0025421223|nr:uncharacterized protein N7477_005273 [Penicillium maclennaniae]KAJ5669910.1 hypothetical protein N7477_005273 [Penicillium maclennaniae]
MAAQAIRHLLLVSTRWIVQVGIRALGCDKQKINSTSTHIASQSGASALAEDLISISMSSEYATSISQASTSTPVTSQSGTSTSLSISRVSVAAILEIVASPLGAYNVDSAAVSVSGLSSGGFMSAQLGVAYSNVFQVDFGVFAGGPFDCARNQAYTTCMYNQSPSITTPTANMKSWSGNEIATTSNLANRKIYLWEGSADTTVGPNVMNALHSQLSNFDTSADVSYVTTSGAVHTFPTDFDGSGDNSCSMSTSPYISNCNYDGAGAGLQWIYGSLNTRNTGTLTGSVVSFAQTGEYVPLAWTRPVIFTFQWLHGLQANTGYNIWADTNNIIILYPQAIPDNTMHSIWGGSELSNPNGCWDWVGWYGANADQIGGVQMVAIANQVAQVMSGNTGGGTSPGGGVLPR